MKYKTYAEAKIANPDCEIVTTGKGWEFDRSLKGVFQALVDSGDLRHNIADDSWVICNPADHCSTLKEFLDAGLKLVEGDKFIGIGGYIVIVKKTSAVNVPDDEDVNRYILSAAALNGGCKIEFIEHKAGPWTIYNNTMPLSELSDGQAAQLFNAWRTGGEIEFSVIRDDLKFEHIKEPSWINVIYRAKPKSERELFIAAAINHGIKPQKQTPSQIFGELFDSGRFEYKDNTQYFGENI